MTTDDDEYQIAQMRIRSAAMVDGTASALPADDQLTADAAFMRRYHITPMEFMTEVMVGAREATPHEMVAAKSLLPYAHRLQATKNTTVVTVDADALAFAKALDLGTLEQLEQLTERIDAQEQFEVSAARH